MGLSKEQYDRIMQGYAKTQSRNLYEQERRKHLIYAKFPEYQQIEEEIPSLGMESLRITLYDPDKAKEEILALKKRIHTLSARKAQILREHGYPADYLDLHYDCPDCKDTGYIDGKKCHCLKEKEIAVLYDHSNLKKLIPTNNFSLMSDEYYKDEQLVDFHRTVSRIRSFISDFDTRYENIYLYGKVGSGKSFLSISAAAELLKTGHSVLYFSASSLFETISSCLFGNRSGSEAASFLDDLYSTDLLIIDDLGSEYTNNFVNTQLFECINQRHINHKSTIISTNLALEDLRKTYTDRIFSRITSTYTVCRLTGPDVRILKKVRN